MKFVHSESFEEPLAIDENSSPKGVYIRQNIVEETYTNPETGETKPVWRYEEAFISKAEYAQYQVTNYSMNQVEIRREDDIRDELVLEMIDEGII